LEGKRANGQLQAPPRLGRDSAVLPPCARMRRGLDLADGGEPAPGEGGGGGGGWAKNRAY